MFILVFWVLPTSVGRTEDDVPQEIMEQCKQEVLKRQPLKVTYKWGEMNLNIKTKKEVSESCNDTAAAGCFHGAYGEYVRKFHTESFLIGEYGCFYPAGTLNIDFSGSSIDIADEYSSCFKRAVLRHELQHFMNWKSGCEQMLVEIQNTMLDNVLVVCKECDGSEVNKNITEFLNRVNKWYNIITENDARLDEVDNTDLTIVDQVCAKPKFEEYSLF